MSKLLKLIGVVTISTVLLAGTGCSRTREQLAENAVSQIWAKESERIGATFKTNPGDKVKASAAWMEDGLYIVFFAPDAKQAVAFDLGSVRRSSDVSIVNSGFAKLQFERHWSLLHTNESIPIFEPNGGMWTIEQMSKAIELASACKPTKVLIWR